MRKLFLLATAAFLFTGFAYSNGGDGKKCAKGKECSKDMKECKKNMKDCKDMKECKKNMKDCKDMKKDVKTTNNTAKEASKTVAKA